MGMGLFALILASLFTERPSILRWWSSQRVWGLRATSADSPWLPSPEHPDRSYIISGKLLTCAV